MTNEQREALHKVLMGPAGVLGDRMDQEFSEMVTGDIIAIEPLIDEMIRQASEAHDIEEISLPVHAVVQLLAFLKFHEWHEPRPGYHECPECKIQFMTTPDSFRRHRDHCRVGELIKFLQAKIETHKGSDSMPFPNTRAALEEHGYTFKESKICPSCNVTIEMWNTPKQNVMPLDFKKNEHGIETCEPHFATCKNPELYSRRLQDKKKREEAKAADAGPIIP